MLKEFGVFKNDKVEGRVVYADDQFICQRQILHNFSDLQIEDKLTIYSNGVDTIKFFEYSFLALEEDDDIQPVSLLLLDINMPIMHGLECSKKVKQMYIEANQERLQKNQPPLISPLTCFMTQTPFEVLKTLIKDDEMTDLYFEKPMNPQEMQNLLKILMIDKKGK